VTVTAEWQEVAERLAASARRPLVVLVMGAMDTGKSTLCAFLARFLFERGRRVAVVDADLGQSDIGLPTTIGVGFVERPIERLREIAFRAAYFVGATSPVGHLLPTVVGTKLMVERALAMGAEVVIVDTDGLVHGGVGWALKHYTFEAVRPTHVVLLQRAGELAHYQHQWQGIVWTEVISVPVPEAVVPKSREMRRAFRQERFREWLQQCRESHFAVGKFALAKRFAGAGRFRSADGAPSPFRTFGDDGAPCRTGRRYRVGHRGPTADGQRFHARKGVVGWRPLPSVANA
jgi:polynucleotide 5'-hydroxyl-kinase GRC3/NOL9